MSDLNTARPRDRAVEPYRCWDEVLLVSDMDERAIEQLRTSGFEIVEPNYAAWTAPKPFKLSAA